MEVNLNKWYKCTVDKAEFKKLCQKSDWQGFKHMIIYFSALFISGYLAYATWGTWWCVLFFFKISIDSCVSWGVTICIPKDIISK